MKSLKNQFYCQVIINTINLFLERINMNHYQVLSIPNNASKQEIRNAYIFLAKKYHPDKIKSNNDNNNNNNNNDNDNDKSNKFKVLHLAYSTLINDETRKEYDINLKCTPIFSNLFQDLLNDFNKLVNLIKPVTNYDTITSIHDLYKGSYKKIYYENMLIKYYPIKSLQIEFENEILKLNNIMIDNLNYFIEDFDLYIHVSLNALPDNTCVNNVCKYDLELPDSSIINVVINEEDINKIICYNNKGLIKQYIYKIMFSDNDEDNDNENIDNDQVRGNLYLLIKK